MKEFPTIVSYYTQNTLYQLEVQNLIASCAQFGLKTHIEGIESFGTWELNCAYKPFFLYQKLLELQKELLWVDADGVFVQKPERLEAFSSDLAVRINDDLPATHNSKVMSGVVYVNNTDKAKDLLRAWAKECMRQLTQEGRTEEFWDQVALRDVLLHSEVDAKVQSLPLTYVKIVNKSFDEKKHGKPVIEHYQASRRYKRAVNGN